MNLFDNGSVEVNANHWGGWGGTIARSNVQAKLGSWSIRATGVIQGWGATFLSPTYTVFPDIDPTSTIGAVTPDATYTASVWIRSDNGNTYVASMRMQDADGIFISTVSGTPTVCPAATWTLVSVTCTMTPNTKYAWAVVSNQSAGTDAFYADAATFELGPWVAPSHTAGTWLAADYNNVLDGLQFLYCGGGSGLYLPTPSEGLEVTLNMLAHGAFLIPTMSMTELTVSRFAYRGSTANANIDCGIYEDDGNGTSGTLLTSAGSTPMPVGAGAQSIPLLDSVTLKPYVKYWLAMSNQNNIAKLKGTQGPVLTIARRARQAHPLPDVIAIDPDIPPSSPCFAVLP